ncbi:sensor domain-containing diguanylate cyclase [Jeongeupia naejangsanensis]|uniref:diguanylate cyclase n=1 Tax=Jeongeupia naejangsanensis TaxID=613195 RepID=A0ABS2BKP7_9NEIS|nr:diguanylate cyclase [Jeongeupia naejangsanensis]MBM3115399.1 diguanylate cyclase [Jeongeupia naejangsanensis]
MVSDTSTAPIYLLCRNGDYAATVSQQLAMFGLRAVAFPRASALLAAIHGEAPLAVLVDEAGCEDMMLTQVLPMIARLNSGPLVYLSLPMAAQEQIELARAGVTDFLPKPFDSHRLIDQIDRMLEAQSPQPARVLIVDDSETLTHWASNVLTMAGMRVRSVKNPLKVPQLVALEKPELILLDMYMPECTGDELAKVLRQNPAFDGIPIVFLSSETQRGRQLSARRMGGDDFLVKNNDPDELIDIVAMMVDRYRRLRELMTRDSLTRLLNHTHLIERLLQEVARAHETVRPLAFAMIDIDHFKSVNDRYGHAVGDRVIKSLARLLRQNFPGADLVGRYGGEEFSIIFPDASLLRAAQQVDDLRQRFSELCHISGNGEPLTISFSAGVAQLGNGMQTEQLIETADAALYQAKAAGRNQVGLAR